MNCPVCDDVRMREVEKEDILIDVCPSCKGVWLDRGELDKLMSGVREVRNDFNEWYEHREDKYRKPEPNYDNRPNYDQHRNHDQHAHNKHKKKKGVLDVFGDLFGD